MFANFRADLKHHFSSIGADSPLDAAASFFEMSLWAIGIFRFGKRVQKLRIAIVRWPLMAIYFLLYKISQAISGIRISLESEIGPGLVIHNFGGVVVHGRIGANCIFVQGAQMISRADGKGSGWPTMGDNVYVGAGAKLLGNVAVGNNTRIGANAVVMTDVPDGAVVMPPQCRIILPIGTAAAVAEGTLSGYPGQAPLRERVQQLLRDVVLHGRELPADDSVSLLEYGLIDSLGILALAESIPARFSVAVEDQELMPENLDSVEAIRNFLVRKGVRE
jgi:serine O-acetyltransferase